MRDWKSVSPSQFHTFSDCKRQWWFQSVFGLSTPQRPSAALGEAVHTQLEAYIKSIDAAVMATDCKSLGCSQSAANGDALWASERPTNCPAHTRA